MITVTNESGDQFNVVILKKGDRYGLDNCLTHDKDRPVIEFYDAEYPIHKDPHGKILGQFVSRYYTKTLLESNLHGGLCLDGGISKWHISSDNLKDVITYINQECN